MQEKDEQSTVDIENRTGEHSGRKLVPSCLAGSRSHHLYWSR